MTPKFPPIEYVVFSNESQTLYFFAEMLQTDDPSKPHPGYFMDYYGIKQITRQDLLKKEGKTCYGIINFNDREFEIFMNPYFKSPSETHMLMFRRKDANTDTTTIFNRTEDASLTEKHLKLLGFTKRFTFIKDFK